MTNPRCTLIGARVQVGAGRLGCDMGPSAYRTAGIREALADLGFAVEDRGNVAPAPLRALTPANPAIRDLTTALNLRLIWGWRLLISRADFARSHRALDMLGVRFFLDKPGGGTQSPGVRLVNTSDFDVLESDSAWPRAFFTDAVLADGADKARAIARPNIDAIKDILGLLR